MKKHTSTLLTVVILIISQTVRASIPTPEALFRNASNKQVTGDFIVLNFSIEEVENHMFMNQTVTSEANKEDEKKLEEQPENFQPRFLQLLIEKEKSQSEEKKLNYGSLQVEFHQKSYKKNQAKDAIYFPSFKNRIKKDTNAERAFFYSLLMMLAMNDEDLIVDRIQKLAPEFKTNKELLNKKKMALYEDYKTYLAEVKKEQESKDQNEENEKKNKIVESDVVMTEDGEKVEDPEKYRSPFKAKKEEKQKEINETLESRMYEIDKHVQLKKEGLNFYWELNYKNLKAEFSNRDQKLTSLQVKTDTGVIEFKCREYILFDGVHELPKSIYFKTSEQRLFKIRLLKYKDFKNNGPSLSERAQEYRESLQKANAKSSDEQSEGLKPLKMNFIY